MAKTKHQPERVGIFVDIQNLYHSAKNIHHSRVNYKELIRNLVGRRQLIRALAYVVKSDTVLESTVSRTTGRTEASFFEALEKSGLELRVKDLQVFGSGAKKADWDVGLAVDAIRLAPSLDVVILVTGDGDFVPLIEYLRFGLSRRVEVAGFKGSSSSRLKDAADSFKNLEALPRVLKKIDIKR